MIIKLFEEFSIDELYTRVDSLNIDMNDYLLFTDKEIDELSKYGKMETYTVVHNGLKHNEVRGEINCVYLKFRVNKKYRFTVTITVYKLADEWYYLTGRGGSWKCDGWEGLINCLKNQKMSPTI